MPTIAELAEILGRQRYNFTNEAELQEGVALVLARASVLFEREIKLSATDRPDFLVGDIAVELKIKGSLSEVLRQLQRYARHERVGSLLLVTARVQLDRVPPTIGGKPASVVLLRSGGAI